MFKVKIDCCIEEEDCPIFEFGTFAKAMEFIRICFDNGYDVWVREEDIDEL